ncbi:MAG: riboflavin synthase, alpha subunit [Solirubrobacterales bacterium]|nr:riboflavin synthase, alpha subunit [Solirubrobacterales bacterium]
MFTGLVEDLGSVAAVDATADGARLTVRTRLAAELGAGDSIAVNGVCLTAVELTPEGFTADVMNETLDRSSLGAATGGSPVNLELALRADGRLGGHIMQGHVDGVGTVAAITPDGLARRISIAAGPELLRYVVEKGSIAIDGVSLTVATVDDEQFSVSLIPETLARTTLGATAPGDRVNLEVDIMAKYAEKMLGALAR